MQNNFFGTLKAFDDLTVQAVWNKGHIVPGYNSDQVRKDDCGAFIRREMYGDTSTTNGNGWEIDHIRAISNGGTDDLSNLRPLQWYNNRTKSDGTLTCPIKA